MKLPIIILLFIFSGILQAQVILSGVVVDSKTNEPVEAANVFIAHTSIGTISEADGSFELSLPVGYSQLVVSHISYKTQTKNLSYLKAGNYKQTIKLVATDIELEEIIVSAKNDKKWRKNLKKFEKAFLGATKNASKCNILNPTVLNFENKNGKLTAKASDLIEIENRATGYNVLFYLQKFVADGQSVTYSVKPFFKELSPQSEKEAVNWKSQREKTYNGSPQHFYRSLIKNTLESDGFEIFLASLQNNSEFIINGKPKVQDLIIDGNNPLEKTLVIVDFLQVVYTKEKDRFSIKNTSFEQSAKKLGHTAEKDLIVPESSVIQDNSDYQVSYLFARKNNVPIDSSGFLLRPELLVEYGYWNYERIADLLPREYLPSQTALKSQPKADTVPALLGFEMKNLQIPYAEIRRGGPPKDGIPSIDRPKFIQPSSADFLKDDDYVLGVEIGGQAKAYPIRILNYHEIVNDWFGEVPVVVTYCPLCGSGAAFSALIDGKHYTFGVSGLLYNSDVLLYDRKTESLWSQIMGKSISGDAAGTPLELIPANHTTWKNWRTEHANTIVLSTDTGSKRDYTKTPYTRYESSDKLMFPVSQSKPLFKNKEKVIGIEIDGKFKAYPFSKLKKIKGDLNDQFNGKELVVKFDKASQSAQIFDESGNELPTITMYWFAWYAFHPDTAIFK